MKQNHAAPTTGAAASPIEARARRSRLAIAARLVGGALVLAALALMAWWPQRPDGDATALAAFAARHPEAWHHVVRGAPWFRVALALLAWGALDGLVGAGAAALPRVGRAALRVAWLGVIVGAAGLLAASLDGWAGELFLEPNQPARIGAAAPLVVAFERFTVPPAPDGPGRALAMALRVDGRPAAASVTAPSRTGDWTITPRWYGATVEGAALAAPLFFGASGSQPAPLRDREKATVTLDLDTLALASEPPLDGLRAHHHAIVIARYAPGGTLRRAGAILLGGGLLVAAAAWADSRRRAAQL